MIESEIIIRQETAGRFGVSNSNGRVDLAELAPGGHPNSPTDGHPKLPHLS